MLGDTEQPKRYSLPGSRFEAGTEEVAVAPETRDG